MSGVSRSRSRSGSDRSRSRSPTPRSRSPTPRSRSRSPRGRRARSRSRSQTPRSRSPSSRSRSRSPRGRRSRSVSPRGSLGQPAKDVELDEVTVTYDDFIPADEEKPTFSLDKATIDLVRSKVYQAAPLNKKFFNEIKKEKYMMSKEVNESLEPKPIPAQVVSSAGGLDLNKLHGGLLHQHKVSRLVQRPLWALLEQLSKSRNFLRDAPATQFDSPPFMGVGAPPEGFVPLQFTDEEVQLHAATAPENPSAADFANVHKRLGVHIKYHEVAERSMLSMAAVIKKQQQMLGHVKGAQDIMWGRSQDYLNMARYQETHLKDMRRSQLYKIHTREFTEWLDNIYMKDKSRLGDRDKSDEIIAADYDAVIKQFNEDRKKNTALKASRGGGGRGGNWGGGRGGGSGSHSRDKQAGSRGGGSSRKDQEDSSSSKNNSDKPRNDYRKPGKQGDRGKSGKGGAQGGPRGGGGAKPSGSGNKKDKTA